LIITGTHPTPPAAAKHDLAMGAATADAQAAAAKQLAEQQATEAAAKSAAQIVADRLPSLHDPDNPETNPATAAAPGATPGGVVPKPLPTLHPDRYSPGSTPPAADLKPGAADRNNPAPVTSPPPSTSTQSPP